MYVSSMNVKDSIAECPCGSGTDYPSCCEPIIDGSREPDQAVQLMRARYTAHTLADVDFIIASHHPDTRHEINESTTRDWAKNSQWLGIDIHSVTGGTHNDDKAEIEFVVSYRDSNGERQRHHEVSEFEKKDSKWYFKDAQTPKIEQFRRNQPKVGRNDPCSCGSGKKFKKCCGGNIS